MHYTQHVMTGLHSYSRSVILSLCAFVVGVLLLFFAVAFVVFSKDRLLGCRLLSQLYLWVLKKQSSNPRPGQKLLGKPRPKTTSPLGESWFCLLR